MPSCCRACVRILCGVRSLNRQPISAVALLSVLLRRGVVILVALVVAYEEAPAVCIDVCSGQTMVEGSIDDQ